MNFLEVEVIINVVYVSIKLIVKWVRFIRWVCIIESVIGLLFYFIKFVSGVCLCV